MVGTRGKKAKLVPLYKRTRSLMNQFLQIEVNHVQRSENDKVDASTKSGYFTDTP